MSRQEILDTLILAEELRSELRPMPEGHGEVGLMVREANHRASLRARASLGWAEQPLADLTRALPYRPRVEVVVTCIVAGIRWCLWGVHDDDGSVAFPGGGIDEGETPETAAVRELAEESGLVATKASRVPGLHGVYQDWPIQAMASKPDDRAGLFRGSLTLWALVNLGERTVLPLIRGESAAAGIRWHLATELPPTSDGANADRSRGRRVALDIVSRLGSVL